ncbi:CHAT domain-containing protein [Calothrix membranacea FACHB-236]|nr:CHAT domain-containing protein [Calothrix membranacea FACHB-236]
MFLTNLILLKLISSPSIYVNYDSQNTPLTFLNKKDVELSEQSKSKMLIAEIIVSGIEGKIKDEVSQVIHIKPGQTVTLSQLQKNKDAIKNTGYFAEVRFISEDTPKGKRVTFEVQPNPVLKSVKIKGGRPDFRYLAEGLLEPDGLKDLGVGAIFNSHRLEDIINKFNQEFTQNPKKDYDIFWDQELTFKHITSDGTLTLEIVPKIIGSIKIYSLNANGEYTDTHNKPISGKTSKLTIISQLGLKIGNIYERERDEALIDRLLDMKLFQSVGLGIKLSKNPHKLIFIVLLDEKNAAELKFDEAQQIEAQGTLKSKQQAITKYEEALHAFRTIKINRSVYKPDATARIEPVKINRFAITSSHSEDDIINAIANSYKDLGEFQIALKYYNQALQLLQKEGDLDKQATMLAQIAEIYDFLGAPDKAQDIYKKVLQIWLTSWKKTLAREQQNGTQKREEISPSPNDAKAILERGLQRWRVEGNRKQMASTLLSLAWFAHINSTQQSLDYLNEALTVFQALENRAMEAETLTLIAKAYNKLGKKQQALNSYRQALLLWRTVSYQRDETQKTNFFSLFFREPGLPEKIAVLHYKLGQNQQAIDFFNQALMWSAATPPSIYEANVLQNIAGIYERIGLFQQSFDYLNEALLISQSLGNRFEEANTLSITALVYINLAENQKALKFLNQALPIHRALNNKAGEAENLYLQAMVYFNLGEKTKAIDYFNQSLPLWLTIGNKSKEAEILYYSANLERDRGNINEALTKVESAIQIIESLRTKVASQELRTSFFATKQDYYELYINLLMQLHKNEPLKGYEKQALQVSERARARSLLEILQEARADIRQGVNPELLQREHILQQQLDALEKQRVQLFSANPTEAQKADLEKKQELLLTHYQELQAEIRGNSPRYAALTQPQPLTVSEIQQQVLDNDTVLLEYYLGKNRSYLWAVTKTGITSYELPKREEIEAVVKRFKQEELLSPQLRTRRVGDNKASVILSKILLVPVADKIKQKRLLIVSDGILQYIPFAALPLPINSNLEVGSGNTKQNFSPLLIEENEIISLPSASTLAVLRQELAQRKPVPKTVALLADPVFSADDPRVKTSLANFSDTLSQKLTLNNDNQYIEPLKKSAREADINFSRLDFTRTEAQEIFKLFAGDGKQALDFAASRTTAINPDLGQYKIVHFATHGILNSINPGLSGIVLSLVDEKGNPQNGFLRLHDIYNLNLPVELVVLSACETGLGQDIKGEGLVGLTRGFMYAGASKVVVSLWSVNDQATAELMTKFYTKMLKEKLQPAAALRAAQIEMLNTQWKAPYYWAAFVIQGEWK